MDKLDDFYRVVRSNIRMKRHDLNITQRELAEKIGVSEGYISDIERDKLNKRPSIKILMKISEVLGVEFIDLLDSERREKYEK